MILTTTGTNSTIWQQVLNITGVLERMRGALAELQSEFGDMGHIPEEQMVATWYPDGTQPQTAAPIFIPINRRTPGDGGRP